MEDILKKEVLEDLVESQEEIMMESLDLEEVLEQKEEITQDLFRIDLEIQTKDLVLDLFQIQGFQEVIDLQGLVEHQIEEILEQM